MGQEERKINFGIFPVSFHGFYRFYTFSCISRASLTIFSPFFHSLPFVFAFTFSPISGKWHNFRFPKSIFEILSRCVFLFRPHISPSGTPVVLSVLFFFLQRPILRKNLRRVFLVPFHNKREADILMADLRNMFHDVSFLFLFTLSRIESPVAFF